MKLLVALSGLTLCDPMGCSPPGSSVLGLLQARMLEWVAIPSPGDLPNPGIKPRSPAWQADTLPPEPPGEPTKSYVSANQNELSLEGSAKIISSTFLGEYKVINY